MENKYFTPDIEDMYIGYECEIFGQSSTKLIKKVDFHPVIVGLHQETSKKVGINQIPNLIKKEWIRVPYLTKEQIEDEGWKFKKQLCSDEFCKGWQIEFTKNEMKYNFSFNQNYSANFYTWNSIEGTHTIFKGKCKDINTFRKICKLLEI